VFSASAAPKPGSATVSLVVNSDNTILDDIWAWRADHGNGIGWTDNTADTGLIVNGNERDRLWPFRRALPEIRGNLERRWRHGHLLPKRDALRPTQPSGVDGGSRRRRLGGIQGRNHVSSFKGYGLGSYSFFNQGVNIYAANAFEVPTTLAHRSMNDLLTIFLSTAGFGGILNVINNTGGSSTIANSGHSGHGCRFSVRG
jgi:hypothetical protein